MANISTLKFRHSFLTAFKQTATKGSRREDDSIRSISALLLLASPSKKTLVPAYELLFRYSFIKYSQITIHFFSKLLPVISGNSTQSILDFLYFFEMNAFL